MSREVRPNSDQSLECTRPDDMLHIWELVVPHLPFFTFEFKGVTLRLLQALKMNEINGTLPQNLLEGKSNNPCSMLLITTPMELTESYTAPIICHIESFEALLSNVVPFNLIAWGQQHIDSSLAAILLFKAFPSVLSYPFSINCIS